MSDDHTKSVLIQNQAMLSALMAQLAKKGVLNGVDLKEISEAAALFASAGGADGAMAEKRLTQAFAPKPEN